MNYKYILITTAICVPLGYYLGRTLDPKIETHIEEVEVIKRDVVTIIKEVVRKDGTKDTTTTIVDRTKERKETEVSIIETQTVAQNHISVSGVSGSYKDLSSYTFRYERRIMGPVWIGAQYNTQQVYGLSLGLEF